MAQVVSAEVYVNSRLVWAAHAKGEAVDEIPLLRNADDTVVTFDDAQAIAENDSVGVAITTVQSTWGGAGFSLAKLPDGHVADANGTIVAEDRLGRPNLLSGVDCGGPIPGLSMYTTVLIAVLVSIGMLVVTVLVTRRLKR